MADIDFRLDLEEVGKRLDNPAIYMHKGKDLRDILFAPPEYWKLTLKEHKEICNGAGPKGYGPLVPDTIWGLNITQAANIHDYMYHTGKTIKDKEEADRVFLNNMNRIIQESIKKKLDLNFFQALWLKQLAWLRFQRVSKYFSAVCLYGGPSFWKGKNQGTNV